MLGNKIVMRGNEMLFWSNHYFERTVYYFEGTKKMCVGIIFCGNQMVF